MLNIDSDYRAGFVGLIGRPNSGKSTLLNTLVRQKVAIVTSKPQTTRQRVIGITNETNAQILWVDSPGLVHAQKGLNNFLQHEWEDVLRKSDVLAAVLSVDEKRADLLQEVVDIVAKSGKPWIAIINKSDLSMKHRIPIILKMLSSYNVTVLITSALQQKQKEYKQIVETLTKLLPSSPAPLYDKEYYTTQNLRDFAREIVREKCFELLYHEIPFGLAVRVISFKEEKIITKIECEIIVKKLGHKCIVVGTEGQQLKQIGQLAREELEKLVGHKVYLGLQVVYREKWDQNLGLMEDLSYVTKNN